MEAARKSFLEFLADGIDIPESTQNIDQVKYQLCLDIAAGIASIHSLNIVHGDLKPDNVLVFENKGNIDVPYIAKLSDFGLCIDLQPTSSSVTPGLYKGTYIWTGPETRRPYDDGLCGKFEPQHFKQFDAFSYGLILVSAFATDGVPLTDERCMDAILAQLGSEDYTEPIGDPRPKACEILLDRLLSTGTKDTRPIFSTLTRLVPRFLVSRPSDRPLPTAEILKPVLSAPSGWNSWREDVDVSQCRIEAGNSRSLAIHGPSYWYRMDDKLLHELHRQNSELDITTSISPATLFGLGLSYSTIKSNQNHAERSREYFYRAACRDYLPAQAIYVNLHTALDASRCGDLVDLSRWCLNAIADGAFVKIIKQLPMSYIDTATNGFRAAGGYNDDPFLANRELCAEIQHLSQTGLAVGEITTVIDSDGNHATHAAAALGALDAIKVLLTVKGNRIECLNDKGETPLLKACAAGQSEVVEFLCANGADARINSYEGISPLHWLFVFPESDLRRVARALVKAGALVNYSIPANTPPRPWRHFPFEWPMGTAMHWATFSGNSVAAQTLVKLGGDVDATYERGEPFTTPLAQAVYHGDATMVACLLRLGANALQLDAKDRTLLHALSYGTGRGQESRSLQHWVSHGSADGHLKALRRIIKCLLEHRVSLERRCNAYGNLTALQQATSAGYFDAHIIQALCLEGADCNMTDTCGQIALHALALSGMQQWSWPQTRDTVMRVVVERTSDVAIRMFEDVSGQNALHMIATNPSITRDQFRTDMQLLLSTTLRNDIDQQNKEGYTPLCVALTDRVDPVWRGQELVSSGASALPSNERGRNVLHAIVSNFHLMDKDTADTIHYYVDRAIVEGMDLQFLTRETSLQTLHTACTDGKLLTVQTLLGLGMRARVNESLVGVTALETAFQRASRARAMYLYNAANYYRARSFLAAAERSGVLYSADFVGSPMMPHNTAPAARLREAHWSYPDVLRTLKRAGGRRVLQSASARRGWTKDANLEIKYEPRWIDKVELCAYSIDAALQPHKAHWQILYDLQDLPSDLDAQAWDYTRWFYDDAEGRMVPTVLTLQCWPQLSTVLTPVEPDWYAAVWYDGCRVEVTIRGERVTDCRSITPKGHRHILTDTPKLDWTFAASLNSYVQTDVDRLHEP
jgi:ankyrin repeat protein/serine/threonine protein kinase